MNTQLPCDIVLDLLPLYADHVCSESARLAVEAHLADCESCRKLYTKMNEALPEVLLPEDAKRMKDDVSFIKEIKHEFTVRQVLTFGILLLFVLFLSVLPDVGGNALYPLQEKIEDIPIFDSKIPAADITVTELYELKDGSIYYTLESEQTVTTLSTTDPFVQDSSSDTTHSSDEGVFDNGIMEVAFKNSLWDRLKGMTWPQPTSFVCIVTNMTQDNISSVAAIQYNGKQNEKKVIWEKGQPIKPAPLEIEKKVAEQRFRFEYEDSNILILSPN